MYRRIDPTIVLVYGIPSMELKILVGSSKDYQVDVLELLTGVDAAQLMSGRSAIILLSCQGDLHILIK